MPLPGSMWNDISQALGSAANANLSAASAGHDLYEAYVWTLVLAAAREEGASVRLVTPSGKTATNFHFRTAPTSIYSTNHDYCHAELQFPDAPLLEAHVGIFVAGKSKLLHECDVAVLDHNEAATCRARQVNPRPGKVLLAIECKYYLSSSLGINLGRSFLGLVNDIGKDGRFFVSTQTKGSVDRLFSRHKREFEIGLSPLAPKEEARLRGSFEKFFRNYQAQNK